MEPFGWVLGRVGPGDEGYVFSGGGFFGEGGSKGVCGGDGPGFEAVGEGIEGMG